MNDTAETHVSEFKKLRVKQLAENMKKKTVMVVSVKGLPSAQFQDIKKKLRGKAIIRVTKKSLVRFALDHCGIKELHKLVKYVEDSTAMLFSDTDTFEISGILANEKSPSKAKAGQIAPFDIEVKAGPTDLLPGPDISALSAVGLAPKVENGKIAIMQDKVILKEGKEVTEAGASIMAKLDIIPFEVGLEPIAAFDGEEKKVYVDIKIDKEAAIEDLVNDFTRALPFAVEIAYPTKETINFILGKAGIEGNAIDALISEDTPTTQTEEAKPGATTEEEPAVKEEVKEAIEEVVAEEVAEEVTEIAAEEEVEKETVKEVVEETTGEELNTDEVKALEEATESE